MIGAGPGHDLLSAALDYAGRGFAVFPLAVGEKIPLISKVAGGHGVLDATSDAAQIRAWWTATPNANIGVAAGRSGLLLVDVDAKDGRDGFTSWEVLRAQHAFDDATPHVWTPNGGKHLWFAAPPGVQLRNTDDELGSGIETKANGMYCVAPPSRLRDGRVYQWDDRLNLGAVPIAPLPPALCRLLNPSQRAVRPVGRRAAPAAGSLATAQDALRCLDPWTDGGYDWWRSILMALHSEHPGPDGLAVAEAWADGRYGEVADKWRGFRPDGGITIGTLYREAEARGWLPPWRTRGRPELGHEQPATAHAPAPAASDVRVSATVPVDGPPAAQGPTGSAAATTPRIPSPRRREVKSTDLLDFLRAAGYVFRLNACDDSIEVNGERMTDLLRAEIRCRLRDAGYGKYLAAAEDAYHAHAKQRAYHPVREYLENLTWHGEPAIARLSACFADKHGVFPTYLRKWLIGAVARAFTGCQNTMLVLDGAQGLGKSEFARWLCPLPNLFSDSSINPDDKDDKLKAMQTWVWEVKELGSTIRRADVESLKSFLTCNVFSVRPAYGRHDVRKPGLASFIGTLNQSAGIFNDATGSRRFMTTTLTSIDWSYRAHLEPHQVWAEAHAAYRAGEAWVFSAAESARAQQINDEYYVADAVEDLLRKYFHVDPANRDRWMSSADILKILQDQGLHGTSRALAMNLSTTMSRLKCERIRQRNEWGYFGIWPR